MRLYLLFSLLVIACCSGCGTEGDARIEGTYTLDATATMEFLKSSGIDDEVRVSLENFMDDRSMQLEFTSDHETTVLEGVRVSRKYQIIDKGPDHVTIKTESTKDEMRLGAAETRHRIDFTDDGFWRTMIDESVREKFVTQK